MQLRHKHVVFYVLNLCALFLAAMSSSRSDVVTQFVLPFVRPFFFLIVSLETIVHLECHKALNSIKDTLRMFQGSFENFSRSEEG